MYDSRFINQRDYKGRLYRNPQTGDLEQFCEHLFIIYPKFIITEDYHAGFILQSKRQFNGFEGICELCGEVIMILPESVFENGKKMEEYINKLLKENEEKSNEKKRKTKRKQK